MTTGFPFLTPAFALLFDDFFIAVLHEQVVADAFRSELVFDDRNAAAVEFGQDAFEQGGLARTEKAGEDGDGNHFVQTARGVHGEAASVKSRL